MDTRIFRVTHDDGSWLNAELRIDINDGFAIIEARQNFGDTVVSCEQLPDDHPAVRRHAEFRVAEADGVPVSTDVARMPCKYAPEGRFCDNAINAELMEAAEMALSYIEAVCFNTPNEKKRRNYADAASKIRAALAKARGEK